MIATPVKVVFLLQWALEMDCISTCNNAPSTVDWQRRVRLFGVVAVTDRRRSVVDCLSIYISAGCLPRYIITNISILQNPYIIHQQPTSTMADDERPAATRTKTTDSAILRVGEYGYPIGHLGHLTEHQAEQLEAFRQLCQDKGLYKPASNLNHSSHDDTTLL